MLRLIMTKKEEINLLARIDRRLFKLTSFRHTFLRSVVAGLGSALGATLVLAIALGFLVQIFRTAQQIPFLGGVLEQINIEEVFNSNQANTN